MKKFLMVLIAFVSILTIGLAQNKDILVPLSTVAIDNYNTTYAGVTYTNSTVIKTTSFPAYQWDSLQYVLHFQDSVSVSSVKLIRYADPSQTVGDTSTTLGTLVSTVDAGKTFTLTYLGQGFTDKNAKAAYLSLLLTFNSTGNTHVQFSRKVFIYAHAYARQ
jgi:hypothetical protein